MMIAPIAPPRSKTAVPTRPGHGGGRPGSCNRTTLIPARYFCQIRKSKRVPASMTSNSSTVNLRE